MTRRLSIEALSAEAFAPFGDVIEATDRARRIAINYGATTRYDDLAGVDIVDGRTSISIFRSTPLPRPISLRIMERHPLGSQAFVPLDRRPFLVVVAPRGDFDAGAMRGFLADGTQGVNYARGTWHHYSLALDRVSDFLVIDRAGEGANLDEVELTPAQQWVADV